MARKFANWLKAYCDFTSTSEAPTEFHFWTGVSTIAATLKRRVWKDENLYKWTPNFYIIFVGPAGVVTKSTTLNIGYQLIRDLKNTKGSQIVQFGPDSMTWHGLGKCFEDAKAYEEYTLNGKTERVLMAPLTCSVSELGTFLRPDDSGLVSFLTDMWDGKERPFQHVTKDSGKVEVENPWLNIIGATTPEWLQNNFPPSLLSEGFGSRIIFIYGEKKRGLVAYPSRAVKPANYTSTLIDLKHDLGQIAALGGPFELTEDAYKWGEAWYTKLHSGREMHMASGRYGGYLARKQTHLHKLAMILSVAKRDALLIEETDLSEADAILTQAEHSMIKVFESVGVVDEAKHLAEVTNFVRVHGWISVRNLYYNHCHNIMSEKDFKQAIRLGLEGGLLQLVSKGNDRGLSAKQPTMH